MASPAASVGIRDAQCICPGTNVPDSGRQTRPCAAQVSAQLLPSPEENHCTGGSSSEARRPQAATCALGHKHACTVEKMCANSGSHTSAFDFDKAVTTPLSSSWQTTSTSPPNAPATVRSAATAPSMGSVPPGATLPYSSARAWQAASETMTSEFSNGSDKAHAKLVAKSAAGILGLGGGGGARGAIRSSDVTMHWVCVSCIWCP